MTGNKGRACIAALEGLCATGQVESALVFIRVVAWNTALSEDRANLVFKKSRVGFWGICQYRLCPWE